MRKGFLTLLAAALSQAAVAAPPDSGGILQQFEQERRREQAVPLMREPEIRPLAAPEDEGNGEVRLVPRAFDIRNASRFPASELAALLSDTLGQELSLTELKQRVLRITDYYHRHGYPAAYAYLPPQTIGEDGKIEIRVIEGYLGEIHLKNESRLANKVIESRLPNISTGDVIELGAIERPVLLMDDIPGIAAQTVLNPGKDSGFADIDIILKDRPWIGASLNFDNQGSRYTGDGTRKSLRMELRNPSRWGDLLELNIVDGGPGLSYLDGGYQLPALLTGPLTVDVTHTQISYRLGGSFASAGMQGTTRTSGLELGYPLIRGERINVKLAAGLQQKDLHDQTLATSEDRRRIIRNQHLSLSGNWRNDLCSCNSWSIVIASGDLNFTDRLHRLLDANSANTQGWFNKVGWTYMHYLKPTAVEHATIFLSANGQISDKNLDSSEKMVLGGAHGVRAYPSSEGMGDDGALLSAELRYRLQAFPLSGVSLSGFTDYGHVKYNQKPWAAVASNNTLSLAGAGTGIRYDYSEILSFSLQKAWRLTAVKPTAGTDTPNGRLWLEISLNLR